MSDEHFTVDGTLIEAWASQKSFRRKDGQGKPPGPGGEVDFHGEKRKNQTHESTTDPDARLFKKSKGSEAKLRLPGTCIDGEPQRAFGADVSDRGEWKSGAGCGDADGGSDPAGKRVTLGGDKNYDTQEFVGELRGMNITPHVAQNNTNRRSAVDERTTRHAGYEVSQRKRKRVEQVVRVDEDGRDAKESEVARDRQGRVAVYLHRSCLQPLPIAKPDGQNMKELRFGSLSQIEQPKALPHNSAKTQEFRTKKLEKLNSSTSC